MEDKNKTVLGGQEIEKSQIQDVGGTDSSKYDDAKSRITKAFDISSGLSVTPSETIGQVPFSKLAKNVSPYIYTPAIDEQEQMAWGQPTGLKLAAIPFRAAITALESVASIPGTLYALGDWAAQGFSEDEFANAFSNGLLTAVSNTSEDIKDKAFSIYTPAEVANGNLWRNLGSSSFWATQGADGIGFLVGAYLTGGIPVASGLGKGLTAGLSKLGIGKGVAGTANIADDILNAAAKASKQSSKLLKPSVQLSTSLEGSINNITGIALNTGYEASVEGIDIYNRLIEEGKTPEQASEAAARTFKTNAILLLPSNAWEQAMMFNSFRRGVSSIEKKLLGENRSTTKLIDKVIDKSGIAATAPKFSTVDKLKKFGKQLGTGAVTEGFWEEGLQVLTQKLAADEKSLFNLENSVAEYFGLMLGDDADSKEYWQSVFLGGLLGGGLASIRGVKDLKKEEGLVSTYHGLIKDSWLDRTKVLDDFLMKDKNGKVVYEDGKPKVDPKKVVDGAKNYVDRFKDILTMGAAKEAGKEELYNNIKTRLDLDLINSFLQVEGGLELFERFINSKSESESRDELKRLGVSTEEISNIKDDLLKKAKKLDEIKKFVADTNDPTLRNVIKTTAETEQHLPDFINKIGNAKLSAEMDVWYALDRISVLKDKLEAFGINVDSDLPLDNLVESLSKQLNDSKDPKITAGVKNELKEALNGIKSHVNNYSKSKEKLSKLYNNSAIKEAFVEHIQEINAANEAEDNRKNNVVKAEKTKNLSEELQKIYNEGVETENIDLIKKPTDILDTQGVKVNQITHRAVLAINTADGIKYARVGEPTTKGNLSMQLVEKDKFGTFVPSTVDSRMAFINADGSFRVGQQNYSINLSTDIKVELTAQETKLTIQERIVSELINEYVGPILDRLTANVETLNFHRERIEKYRKALTETLNKYTNVLTEDQLDFTQVKVGTEYKTIEDRVSKKQKQVLLVAQNIYITVAEAREAISESEKIVFLLEGKVAEDEARSNELSDKFNNYLEQGIPLEAISKELIELSTVLPSFRNQLYDHRVEIANLKNVIKKAMSLIKGYNTTIADILGITLNRNIALNRHEFVVKATDGIDYEYSRVKDGDKYKYYYKKAEDESTTQISKDQFERAYDSYYVTLTEEGLDEESELLAKYLLENPTAFQDKFIESNVKTYKGWFSIRPSQKEAAEYAALKQSEIDTLIRLRNKQIAKINEARRQIEEQESQIGNINKSRSEALTNQKKYIDLRNKFLDKYKAIIGKFFSVQDFIEQELYNTKLDKIGGIEHLLSSIYETENKEIVKFYEEAPKHVFTGDWQSFLFSANKQEQASDNPDVARWYAFVNTEAYKKDYGVLAISKKAAEATKAFSDVPFFDDTDIKLVIVYKGTNIPVRMDDSGKILKKGSKEGNFVHASLPEANDKYTDPKYKDKDRFSINAFVEEHMKDNKSSVEEAEKAANDAMKTALVEYKKFRQSLLTSKAVYPLDIESISAGKTVNAESIIDINEGFSVNPVFLTYTVASPDANEETGEVVDKIVMSKVSGTTGPMRAGFTYANYTNRKVLVTPKMLSQTGDVDNIFNLYLYVATHLNKEGKEGEHAEAIRNYLETVIFNSVKVDPAYRIAFIYKNVKDKKTDEVSALLFGDTIVSLDNLAKGKSNAELKSFLKNKYWNFDKKLLENKETEDFTEYRGTFVKGKFGFISETHDGSKGGYKKFLFSQKKSKGLVKLNKAVKSKSEEGETVPILMAHPSNAQFLNQSLKLKIPVEESIRKEEEKVDKKKAATVKKETVSKDAPIIEVDPEITLIEVLYKGKRRYIAYNENTNKFIAAPITPESAKETGIAAVLPASGELSDVLKALRKEESKEPRENFADISVDSKGVPFELILHTGKVSININPEVEETEEASSSTPIKEVIAKEATDDEVNSEWEKADQLLKDYHLKHNNNNEEEAKQAYYASLSEGSEAAFDTIEVKKTPVVSEKPTAEVKKTVKKSNSTIDGKTIIERRATKLLGDYVLEDTDRAISWFKEHFPEFNIESVKGLINSKAWGSLVDSSHVLLSDIAEVGTIYHEAFHVWSLIFKEDGSLDKLYNELRTRLNKPDLTDKQANEILAEEFRDFMMMGESYKFNKITEPIKESFFRKILNMILKFFGKNIPTTREITSEMEKAFNELRDGVFTQRLNENKGTIYRIAGLGVTAQQRFVEDINARFFKFIMGDLLGGGDVIINLEQNIDTVYAHIKSKYDFINREAIKKGSKGGDAVSSMILEHWDDLVKSHKLHLTQYRIKASREIDEENMGRQASEFIESMSKDLKEEVPSSIRLLIAAIPDVNKDLLYNKIAPFNTVSTVQFSRMMNTINNSAATASNPDELFKNISKLQKKYPAIKILLNVLGFDTSGKAIANSENLNLTQFILRTQMYNSFANTKNIPTIGIKKTDGTIQYIYPVDEKEISIVRAEWKANGIGLAEAGKTPYIKKNKGDYSLEKERILSDISKILTTKSSTNLTTFLKRLGFDISSIKEYDEDGVHVQYIRRLSEALRPIDNPKYSDLFSGDVIKNQSELDAVVETHSEEFFNDSDLTYLNFNNDQEWSITRNSHVTETINRLNSHIRNKSKTPREEIKHIWNLYTESSKVLERVGNKLQREITFGVIKGIKDVTEEGKELKEAYHPDYLMASFDSVLNGSVPLLRAGDRGPEYTVSFFSVNKGVNEESFINDAFRYIEDELRTSIALRLLGIGKELNHYKERGKELRTFSFVYEQGSPKIDKFLGKRKAKNLDEVRAYAQEYIETNKTVLRQAFKTRLELMKRNNLDELIKWKLVIKEGDRYIVPGLNKSTLEDYGINYGENNSISSGAMQKILTAHAYNYFVNTQEQLRLLFGDMAMYKDRTEFHKRLTSATSSKTELANDDTTIELLNKFFPNLFTAHDKYITKITFDKVTRHSDLYNTDMDVADGQEFGTLDFVRSVMIRQGKWNDHEKTYQFETQKLLLQIIDDPELLKILGKTKADIKRMFTSGVFSKHTGKTLPVVPMYNGEEIDEYDLVPIPALKPLGVGPIQQINNLYAHSVNKMSVGAMYPSTLPRKGLKIYVSMLANGIDMIGDSKTEKATSVIGGKFGEITKATPSQKILYDDFGIQLDIEEDEAGRVTESTQKNAVLFVDMYDAGTLQEKFNGVPANLIEEHKRVINAIDKTNLNKVIEDLGLGIEDGKYILKNKDKFKEELTKAFVTRIMPDNVIDSIADFLDSATQAFDILINKKELDNVLLSIVKNRTIKRKVPGEMKVQESPLIYEEEDGTTLKSYTPGQPMEVMTNVPRSWNNWIKTLRAVKDGKTYVGIDALNILIEKKAIPENLYTYTANRIPTAAINTIEAFVVKKFLPSYVGPKVVLPGDVTIKASSDFDIDKLTTYLSNFIINGSEQPKYIEYLTKENSTTRERAERIFRSSSELFRYFEGDVDSLLKYVNNIKKVISEAHERFPLLKEHPEYIDASNRIAYLDNYIRNEKDFKKKEIANIERGKYIIVQRNILSDNFAILEEFNKEKEEFIGVIENAIKDLPIEEQNTKKALENRLNEITYELLLNEDRFEDLKRPHSSSHLKDITNAVRKQIIKDRLDEIEATADYLTLSEWWYNSRKYQEFQSSKQLVAYAASNNVVNARKQKSPITITEPIFTLYFKDQEREEGEEYTSGFILDSEGSLTADNYGQWLVGAVDAVKDPFIFSIMPDIDIFKTYSLLNSTGINAGVGLQTIARFMAQPIIREYIRESAIRKSVMSDYNVIGKDAYAKYFGNNDTIIDRILAKHKSNHEKLAFPYYREYIQEIKKAQPNQEKIDKLLAKYRKASKGYKYLTEADLSKNDSAIAVQVLDNFLTYSLMAGEMISVNSVIRPDAHGSFPKNSNSLENKLVKKEDAKNSVIFGGVKEHLQSSYISSADMVMAESFEMFRWSSFIRRNPVLNDLISVVKGTILEYSNVWRKDSDIERAMVKIEDDLFYYAFLTSKFRNKNISTIAQLQKEAYNSYFIGENSIPNQYIKLKEAGLINSELSKALRPVVGEYVSHRNNYRENAYLSTFSKRYGVSQENALVGAIEEMLADPKTEKFAKKLLDFTIMQNGFSGSPIAYTKMIPSSYIAKAMDDYIDKFFKDPKLTEMLSGFPEQFIRNHANESIIVPRIKNNWYEDNDFQLFPPGDKRRHLRTSSANPEIRIGTREKGAGSEYLTIKVIHKDQVYSKNKKQQRRAIYETVLLKLVGEDPTTTNTNYPKYIYEKIEKLGDPQRMLEYYTSTNEQVTHSVLDYNNPSTESVGKTKVEEVAEESVQRRYTPSIINTLNKNEIFVFGSNTEGRHSKGAALLAKSKFGAKYGQARGIQGQTYAIVTKDLKKGERSIPLNEIGKGIQDMLIYAKANPSKTFLVTKIGTNLAGYSTDEIRSLFLKLKNFIPENVILPKEFEVRTTSTAITIVAEGKMTFSYGKNKRSNVKSNTTFEAIKNGERTATTRYASEGHLDYWKKLKIGDNIEFKSSTGEKIVVRVTKPLYKLEGSGLTPERWSQLEGWSVEYFNSKVKPKIKEAWQFQYEVKPKTTTIKVANTAQRYQLRESDISEANIQELDDKMRDFFDAINVTLSESKILKNKFGEETTTAIADLTNMTVKVLEGKTNVQTLPEEAAHFYVHLLNKDSGLYKAMISNIVNHPIYSIVKDSYKELYDTEEEFRQEAIGQVIAKVIVNEYKTGNERLDSQANTWWNVLWNWVKNLFNKRVSDPYAEAAYNILNNKIDELILSKKEGSEMYQLTSIKEGVNDVFKQNPELSNIGTKELYSQYLDTIFPDSKVKDIVYHGTPKISKNNAHERLHLWDLYQDDLITEEEYNERIKQFPENPVIEKFDKSKIGSQSNSGLKKGFYFSTNKKVALWNKSNNLYGAVVNSGNPQVIEGGNKKIEFSKLKEATEKGDVVYKNTIDALENNTELLGNTVVVQEPEQIHILGSKQDIEGFKKFVNKPNLSKESNIDELSKVTSNLDMSDIITTFDDLFPSEVWRDIEEKEAIVQAIYRGDIEISCKI
jgi:hypothetical protein